MAINVLPPSINESDENFTLAGEKNIRFGLNAIKNVGSNVVHSIVSERKNNGTFDSMANFLSRVDSKDLNKKSLESLIRTGAFDTFKERNRLLENIQNLLDWSREIKRVALSNQIGLFGGTEYNLTLASTTPATKKQKLAWERELLGLYVTESPLNDFKEIFKKVTSIANLTNNVTNILSNQRVKVGGMISNVKKIVTRNGNPMLFMKVEDLTSKIEVVTFPSILQQKPELFQENKIVIIKGRIDTRDDTPKIICEDIEEVVEEIVEVEK